MNDTEQVDRSDWPSCNQAFRSRFASRMGGRHHLHPSDKNFITDEQLGYVRCGDTTVEVTTGWFMDRRVYGLTWPRGEDGSIDARDRLAHSLDEVESILAVEGMAGGGNPADGHTFVSDPGYPVRCAECHSLKEFHK